MGQPVSQSQGGNDLVEPGLINFCAGQIQRQQNVVACREGGHQVEGLENKAHVFAPQDGQFVVAHPGDHGFADGHLAGVDRIKAGQTVHQRRFSRTRWSHDRGEIPGPK